MLELELVGYTFAAIILMVAWFKLTLLIGKLTVGKDASMWQIMLFLVLAGPIGWAVLLIIIAYNQVDKHWTKMLKMFK